MSTTPLFDWAAAQEAKREGMDRAYEHAGSTWKVIAEAAAKKLLTERLVVTADDFRQAIPMTPSSKNVWGPFCRRLEAKGWMEWTGRKVVSKQVQGHGNEIREYRSRIYQGQGVAA